MRINQFYSSKAWRLFSKWVLLSNSIDKYFVKCYTCGKIMEINSRDSQAGHLIKITESMATAFDENNVRPQCMSCNRYNGGRQDIFYQNLVKEIGQKKVDILYIKKHNICKLGKFELDLIAKIYSKKIKQNAI